MKPLAVRGQPDDDASQGWNGARAEERAWSENVRMPENERLRRAKEDKRKGPRSVSKGRQVHASGDASHPRGEQGARSSEWANAIRPDEGAPLRREGDAAEERRASAPTRERATQDLAESDCKKPSRKRALATKLASKGEGRSASPRKAARTTGEGEAETMEHQTLFVYGTLRPALSHEIYRLLASHLRVIGVGRIHGKLFDLGAYPGLVLDPRAGWVVGELIKLTTNWHHVIEQLDAYEGCGAGDSEPQEFRRELVEVVDASGGSLRAWVYLLNHDPGELPLIESGDYLAWRRGT